MIFSHINETMFCSNSIDIFFCLMLYNLFKVFPSFSCPYLKISAITKFFITPISNNIIIFIPIFIINILINPSNFLNFHFLSKYSGYLLSHHPYNGNVSFLPQNKVKIYHSTIHTSITCSIPIQKIRDILAYP